MTILAAMFVIVYRIIQRLRAFIHFALLSMAEDDRKSCFYYILNRKPIFMRLCSMCCRNRSANRTKALRIMVQNKYEEIEL